MFHRRKRTKSRRRRLRLQSLEDRCVLASQVLTAIPSVTAVGFDETFSLDLQYEVIDPLSSGPNSLSLQVHYDSSEIEFVTQTGVLADGLVSFEDRLETISDSDPNTDRVWAIAFSDGAGWPDPFTSLPTSLATLQFKSRQVPGATPFNFTANTTTGYDFQSGTISVDVVQETFTVTKSDDAPSVGQLTLRQAILLANGSSEPAIVNFAPGISNVVLSSGRLNISNDITIVGTRADLLTITGNGNDRVFNVLAGNTVTINGLTITGGNATGEGGAISNAGDLTLDSVRIVDNVASTAGGGISSSGALKINSSEISGNEAVGGSGGGIAQINGTLFVSNSTISGNTTFAAGGGVVSLGTGTAVLRNTTIAFNTAGTSGAGLFRSGGAAATVRNTIIIGNTVEEEANEVAGAIDATGSLISGIAEEVIEPLLIFDGPTRFHAIPKDSPAIDIGFVAEALDVDGAALLQDQRTRARVVGLSVDAGAAEYFPAPGFTVTTSNGTTLNESGTSATLDVVLDAPPSSSVVLMIETSDATEALPRRDRIEFGPSTWDVPQTVLIDGVQDIEFDGDIASTISLSIVDNESDDDYDGVDSQSFTFFTEDDEGLGIIVEPIDGLTTSEGGLITDFTVVLDQAPSADVVIGISSSDVNEGFTSTDQLTFTPSNFDTPQSVQVAGADDGLRVDGDVQYTIVTAPAVSEDPLYDGFDPDDVTITNQDNDVAGITVTPTSGLATTEGSGTATFTVVLDTIPFADVTIDLSSDNTDEGTVAPASLTFTPENALLPQTVTITGVDDDLLDGLVQYNIVLAPSTSTDAPYEGLDPDDVAVSNSDNDDQSNLDFGDLDVPFDSLRVDDGPRHPVGSLILGATIDAELDGQPSVLADQEGLDDDGVDFITTLIATGSESTSSLIVESSATAKLDAWIDFDRDGQLENSEHLGGGISIDVEPGPNVITFTIPGTASAQIGAAARFRLSSLGGLSPNGAALDGEVEDYLVPIFDGDSLPSVLVSELTGTVTVTLNETELIVATEEETRFRAEATSFGSVELAQAAGSADSKLVLNGDTFDLTNAGPFQIANFDTVDLSDAAATHVILDAASVTALSPLQPLTIIGESGDSLELVGGDWRMAATSIVDGQFFRSLANFAGSGEMIQAQQVGMPWQHLVTPSDVNNNGTVTAGDALLIINELAGRNFSDSETFDLVDPTSISVWPGIYFDQNGDGQVTALDALRVINELARISS